MAGQSSNFVVLEGSHGCGEWKNEKGRYFLVRGDNCMVEITKQEEAFTLDSMFSEWDHPVD